MTQNSLAEKTERDPIAFIDLNAQRLRLGDKIDKAVLNVINHGGYIMGPEVATLEKDLSAFCGATHSISCANGTDALILILMAKNLGPGDAVFVPSFTFAASAEAVALCNAVPIFVDVDANSYNMCPTSLEKGIAKAKELKLTPRGVMTVDLFGATADYDHIENFCNENKLWLLCDAAQSFGASYKGRKVGTIGMATATSFFPAKPLGCYGDGGAVFTDDSELAAIMTSLRVHGKGTHKYDNARIGLNARLDTLQAAILIEKLKIFGDELQARQKIAQRYNDELSDCVRTPLLDAASPSAWAQYTIQLPNRDKVAETLQGKGVPTAIYYPKPLHQQTAYQDFPCVTDRLPTSEKLAQTVLSLPMHPYLDVETQDYIIKCVRDTIAK